MKTTYDWRNHLNTSVVGNTSTYNYDHNGNRLKTVEGPLTTMSPSDMYSALIGGIATSTKHIFANGLDVAAIEKVGATATTRYMFTDHLGGTTVITDASSTIVETMDYYPYGALKLDTKGANYVGEKRKYIGEQYDSSSGLNYLNARYQSPTKGTFISQDPMFLGNPKSQNLIDPQSMNSYSYANDNPVVRSDPSGRCLEDACVIEIAAITAPAWLPWVGPALAGVGAGLSYITTDMLLRQNGGLRYEPFDPRRLVTIPEPNLFNDNGGPPNTNPKVPNWVKGAIVVGGGAMVVAQMVENALSTGQSSAPISIGSSQGVLRPSPTNSPGLYTSAPVPLGGGFGVYTTPSGALVDSHGNLISAPTKK